MAIDSKRKGKAGGARVITYTTLVDENTGEVWLIGYVLAIHCVEFLHLVMEHRSIEKTISPFVRNMAYSIFSTKDSSCYCCICIRISS